MVASSSLESFLTDFKTELPPKSTLFGLTALGKSWCLGRHQKANEGPTLAILDSRAEARNLLDNLHFFLGSAFKGRVHYLPPLEFDFYRGLFPNPEIVAERNVTLFHALNDPKNRLFITTLGAVLQKAIDPEHYLQSVVMVKPNDEILREDLIRSLISLGYQRQPTTYDPGVFSVRGAVIDFFSPLYDKPMRIEFFGDLVEEVRFFDFSSQRSLDTVDSASIIPVGVSLLPPPQEFAKVAGVLKQRLDALGVPKLPRDELLLQIAEGVLPPENSFLFPLVSQGSKSCFDYFDNRFSLFWDGAERLRTSAIEKEIPYLLKHHELFETQPAPIAPRESLFLTIEELDEQIGSQRSHYFEDFEKVDAPNVFSLKQDRLSFAKERGLAREKHSNKLALESFSQRMKAWMEEGYRVSLVSHTQTHSERAQTLFRTHGIQTELIASGTSAVDVLESLTFSNLHLWQGFLSESVIFPSIKTVLLSEEEIFGAKRRVAKSQVKATDIGKLLNEFRDLKENDFIVHMDHGIGRYLGLRSMTFQETVGDYVVVEYRDGDKLYVPVYRLNVLQKYSGSEGAAPIIDKMGGDRWIKVKAKAEKAVAELAAELLNIQAKRKLVPAFAFSAPSEDYDQFEMSFPFDETPDQLKSIEEVMADLSESHPMDRLLCGDVGYGKTEVAMRASFRALMDKKQVAVLVPTTVLAFQHFQNFKNRFRETAARIEMVNRLRNSAEIKKTLDDLKAGKVDIVIGTHRLLSSDISFRDLGLLVVDEEHRFGVVHKERLKKICENVHVLSMTATPIPRTLNMAMIGVKDISIITTPPPDRLSVRTFVCRRGPEVIVEAIRNELARDGQVFFVHNRIESIYKTGEELHELFPKIRIEIVHGQMESSELERKMLDFYHGDFHILLTTAIIESGLDIPRANTIIIDDSDHFGLAQLYQLRGRVGRSDRRAYCYLMVPGENLITAEAKQRLQVIQRYTDLGAGFNVASHDLELRGAGDLLGKDQSGHITAVGVDLYFDLLEESVRELRGEMKKITIEPEITLKLPAYFPADYVPDVSERITIYRRLSSVEDEERVSQIEAEIRDRFGELPAEVHNLLGLMKIKLYLKRLHVLRMSCGPKKTSLQFADSTPVNATKIVELIKSNPNTYSLTPDQKLVFPSGESNWQEILDTIRRIAFSLGIE